MKIGILIFLSYHYINDKVVAILNCIYNIIIIEVIIILSELLFLKLYLNII